MAEKKPPVIGVVSVRQAWIDETGLGQLFRPMNPETKAEIYALPVVKYNVSHSSFLEIEWYPKVLEGKPVQLFIPNREVIAIAIIGPKSEEDLSRIGFQL